MALYSEKVMDHFMNPRNVGSIENASGVGEVGNAKCGDIMKIYLQIENDIIVDCKFETFGCGSAIASSSMATEMIIGKSIHPPLICCLLIFRQTIHHLTTVIITGLTCRRNSSGRSHTPGQPGHLSEHILLRSVSFTGIHLFRLLPSQIIIGIIAKLLLIQNLIQQCLLLIRILIFPRPLIHYILICIF